MPERCDHCGSNPYFSDNFPRLRDQNARLRNQITRDAARHAVEVAKLKLELTEQEENHRWLQSKVRRQSKALTRLQEKKRGS